MSKLNTLSSENFSEREIKLFEAVSQYANQLILEKDIHSIYDFFTNQPKILNSLKDYFYLKFSAKLTNIELETESQKIESLKTDDLSSIIISIFQNIVRTNFFINKESIAFKIETKDFKTLLTGLQPNFEIFVYHQDFMGIHLRVTKVSRGGLRWSEREDFREEIRSLMITQDGKNSIIVPAGAKGGFKITISKEKITKDIFNSSYSNFINNLLDLADNKVENKTISNIENICYDKNDTYFVVAADKGTAQMSDVANGISISRNFWLGDAFASGGSNGYSHKDLGITAKGSFVSTERFFIEKDVDIYKKSISIIGIGSMNGDVFGNGINLSSKFKLIGAISHKEIFLDPNPNIETAFEERTRLFNSKNGAWSQYDKSLISQGGAVFQRADKNITISKEIQKVLKIDKSEISGDELIKTMLKAKVDLLFNGGVGTYVKSSEENENEVSDVGNRNVRVDAKDLQAFAVCEGGNLGFTQKARVEYSTKGGKINLDGIDNSAGVNISDHEVNIKILLSQTDLSDEKKSEVMKNATDEVVKLVLDSSFKQALGLSLDEKRALGIHHRFAKIVDLLEKELPQFKREFFAIPSHDFFNLTRPNLAFLFSYSKILITDILLRDKSKEPLIDSFYTISYLVDYFPKSLSFLEDEIVKHPLRREIIAMTLADRVINFQGVTFLENLSTFGEEEFINILFRYFKVERILNADDVRDKLVKKNEYAKMLSFEDGILNFEKEFKKFARKH